MFSACLYAFNDFSPVRVYVLCSPAQPRLARTARTERRGDDVGAGGHGDERVLCRHGRVHAIVEMRDGSLHPRRGAVERGSGKVQRAASCLGSPHNNKNSFKKQNVLKCTCNQNMKLNKGCAAEAHLVVQPKPHDTRDSRVHPYRDSGLLVVPRGPHTDGAVRRGGGGGDTRAATRDVRHRGVACKARRQGHEPGLGRRKATSKNQTAPGLLPFKVPSWISGVNTPCMSYAPPVPHPMMAFYLTGWLDRALPAPLL